MRNAIKYIDAPESFVEHTLCRYEAAPNGCWLWTGSTTADGYAQANYKREGRQFAIYAHVLSYMVHNGDLIEGMEIDHACHDPETCAEPCQHRRCINPAHLVQMPGRENGRRSGSPIARNEAKTCCPRGHEYDKITVTGRRCSICDREKSARQYALHGASQNARRQARMRTDPDYRERRLANQRATARARHRERYANDPEYREKRRAEALARYHRKKAAQRG